MEVARFTLLCSFGLLHCAAPLEAPSAFEEERFLCGEERRAELDIEVERCRDARDVVPSSCHGVFSLRGDIDSKDVVLDSIVYRVDYDNDFVPGGPEVTLVLFFRSPYFSGRLDLDGGSQTPSMTPNGLSQSSYLNFEARGGNYLSTLRNDSYAVELSTLEEFRGSVSADLDRGGAIESCFHLFLPPIAR